MTTISWADGFLRILVCACGGCLGFFLVLWFKGFLVFLSVRVFRVLLGFVPKIILIVFSFKGNLGGCFESRVGRFSNVF